MSANTVSQLRANCVDFAGFDNDERATLARMFDAAESLSPSAQQEFCRAFSLELALNGEIYVSGRRTAQTDYPRLLAEASAAGIRLVMR